MKSKNEQLVCPATAGISMKWETKFVKCIRLDLLSVDTEVFHKILMKSAFKVK